MQRRSSRFFIIAAGAALIAIGAYWALFSGKNNAPGGGGVRKIAVATVAATEVDFPVRRQAIALVESPATVTILSRVDSQIVEQHVQDGQLVRKGELLFVLDDREIKAAVAKDEATISKDEALLVQSLADLKRAEELLIKKSASQQQVDQATANERAAAATLAADKAVLESNNLKLSYTRIYAPITGRVGSVRVTPGNLVKANDQSGGGLVTITQVQPLRVSFALPERDLPLLRQATSRGKQPTVHIEAPGSKVTAEGSLNFVDNMVDSASGTITAKATFPNEDRLLWPGQYVQVDAVLGSMPGVIIVPTVALQLGQEGHFVFVVKDDATISIRPVKVLGADNHNSAVSGLATGERVVIEGQNRLTEGTAVSEKRQDTQPESADAGEVSK